MQLSSYQINRLKRDMARNAAATSSELAQGETGPRICAAIEAAGRLVVSINDLREALDAVGVDGGEPCTTEDALLLDTAIIMRELWDSKTGPAAKERLTKTSDILQQLRDYRAARGKVVS